MLQNMVTEGRNQDSKCESHKNNPFLVTCSSAPRDAIGRCADAPASIFPHSEYRVSETCKILPISYVNHITRIQPGLGFAIGSRITLMRVGSDRQSIGSRLWGNYILAHPQK